ncbi:MAG: hypothetical protein QM775_09470 [Pirellulales bacterium]
MSESFHGESSAESLQLLREIRDGIHALTRLVSSGNVHRGATAEPSSLITIDVDRRSPDRHVERQGDGPLTSLELSATSGDFRWRGQTVRLVGKSWPLLCRLWNQDGRCDFATIGEWVWGDDATPESTIRSAVHRLNAKLLDAFNQPPLVRTERGYVLLDLTGRSSATIAA